MRRLNLYTLLNIPQAETAAFEKRGEDNSLTVPLYLASSAVTARPRSASFAFPSCSRTLSGLMSLQKGGKRTSDHRCVNSGVKKDLASF